MARQGTVAVNRRVVMAPNAESGMLVEHVDYPRSRSGGQAGLDTVDLPYVIRCIAFGASPLGIRPRLARGMISQ